MQGLVGSISYIDRVRLTQTNYKNIPTNNTFHLFDVRTALTISHQHQNKQH